MLDGIPIVGLTAPGVLLLVVILVLTGKIVPRVHLEDRVKDAAQWREAYEAEREARNKLEAQTEQLLELAKTTHAVIVAVFKNTTSVPEVGDGDVDISSTNPLKQV